MNFRSIARHTLFVVLIVGIEIFVLKRVDLTFGNFNYIHLFIHPYLLLTLPINFNKYFLLLYAFVLGMIIDMFLGTYGIHAASLLIVGILRPVVYRVFQPREGYTLTEQPSIDRLGFTWMISTTAILLLAFCFFLFSVEAFSYIYFSEILLRSIFSFICSMILIILLLILFNSKG